MQLVKRICSTVQRGGWTGLGEGWVGGYAGWQAAALQVSCYCRTECSLLTGCDTGGEGEGGGDHPTDGSKRQVERQLSQRLQPAGEVKQ